MFTEKNLAFSRPLLIENGPYFLLNLLHLYTLKVAFAYSSVQLNSFR